MKKPEAEKAHLSPAEEREEILRQQAEGSFSLSRQLAEHPVSRMRARGLRLPKNHPLSILAAERGILRP